MTSRLRRAAPAAVLLSVLALGAGAAAPGAAAAPTTAGSRVALTAPSAAEGTFVPIDPVRVLDTRYGIGAPVGPLGAGGTLTFDPAVSGAVPRGGVSAVLLNVTGTQPTEATHVRVWPAGDPVPGTSTVNLLPGQSRPNQAVVPVGSDGRIALYNNSGSTHLVVDVQGFYSAADGIEGGRYHASTPFRILDTRFSATSPSTPMEPGEEFWMPLFAGALRTVPGADPWEVMAVDVNLTVTQPTRPGHLVAWPGDTDAPNVSNANFEAGQTVANHAVIPVSFDEDGIPGIALRNNSTGLTHLVVDLQGWYDDGSRVDGLRFAPSPTTRVADTRAGHGRVGVDDSVVVPGAALPPARAHVVNVTATDSTGPGHLIAWEGEGQIPFSSTVNYGRAEDSPNMATVPVGSTGQIAVTAQTSASHVVVDHLGFFY